MSGLGKISDINLADTSLVSGGQWTLPLSNLLNPLMVARPARCASLDNLAHSQIIIDLERPRAVNLIGLLFHTLSRTAQFRITLKDSEGAVVNTPIWADVTPRLHPTSTLDWEESNYWDGRPSLRDLDLYPRNLWFAMDTPLIAAQIIIEVDDRDNVAAEFDVGYLWVASSWSPAFNFERGRELSLQKRDKVEEALSGHQVGEYRRPRRMTRVTWADLQKDEMMRFLDIGMRAGTVQPVLFIPDTGDQTHLYREAFLSTLETPPSARFNFAGRHSTELTLKEIMR